MNREVFLKRGFLGIFGLAAAGAAIYGIYCLVESDSSTSAPKGSKGAEDADIAPKVSVNFFVGCRSCKRALDACIRQIDVEHSSPTAAQLKELNDALEVIIPAITDEEPPATADDDIKSIYQLLQRAKADGVTAEYVIFKHYDTLIRRSILESASFRPFEPDVAREKFEKMLIGCKDVAKKNYGDVESIEETDDFKLITFVQKHLRTEGHPSLDEINLQKYFINLIRTGQFHLFKFDEETVEMLVYSMENQDSSDLHNFFNLLDLNSNMKEFNKAYFVSLGKYALARHNLLYKEFESQDEIDTEYAKLRELHQTAFAVEGNLDEEYIRRWHRFPPAIAKPHGVPVICAEMDAEIDQIITSYREQPKDKRYFYKGRLQRCFPGAAEVCSAYSKFNRLDIDGSPISYDLFYKKTVEELLSALDSMPVLINLELLDLYKSTLDACIAQIEVSKTSPTAAQLKDLNKAVKAAVPDAELSELPATADEDQKSFYKLIQREKVEGDTAEQVIFKHYDNVIRRSMLEKNPFDSKMAREAFEKMLIGCKDVAKKHYGDVTSIEDTNDYQLITFVQDQIRNNETFEYDSGMWKNILNLLRAGKFHVFNFDQETREMLVHAIETYGFVTVNDFFNSLDLNLSIDEFFEAFGKYALSRRKYILREFKTQDEINAEYETLKKTYQAVVDAASDGVLFSETYSLPAIAKPLGVPVICAEMDAKFDKHLAEYLQNPADLVPSQQLRESFVGASEVCSSYGKFNRLGIDGKPISYDKFYNGTFNEFVLRSKIKIQK